MEWKDGIIALLFKGAEKWEQTGEKDKSRRLKGTKRGGDWPETFAIDC
jgi:hypothetical protein